MKELTTDQKAVLRTAIFKNGKNVQINKCIEEMAELTKALLDYINGRCGFKEVVTEIADVQITSAEMAMMFGDKETDAEIDAKIERLRMRMSEKGGSNE